MESALKQMRMLWMFMLVAAFAYIGFAEYSPHAVPPVKSEFYRIIVVIAVMELAAVVVMRKVVLRRVEEVLRTTPNDAAALMRWRQGQVVTMAMGSAIVLFGFVLRFVGASTIQALPLYLIGIGAIFVFQPKAVQ